MTNFKLTSNFHNNLLPGVGEAKLQGETVYITAYPNTNVTLIRGVNKVKLLQLSNDIQYVSGKVNESDVYVFENGETKLTIKVEAENIKHETELYINTDPVYEATTPFDASQAKRKTTLTAGILILILLVVSVVFGINQKKKTEFNSKSEARLNAAISDYDQSVSEGEIDKKTSRDLFIQAQTELISLKADGYKNQKLDDLLKVISEKESEILGEVSVNTNELLDLTLQINGFEGDRMVSTGEMMFVLDSKNKNIIQVDVNGKGAKIAANKDDLDGLINIASYESRLFSVNNDGIYEITDSKNKIKDNPSSDSFFYVYSGNIYFLDKTANQIYRYAGSGKTFADKTDWLAPGIEADFSKVKDMTIDGSIWLISSTGKVTKFTNGNPNSVSLDGITENIENPTSVYTNEELKYTYILERDKQRVIVLEKNGDFKMQYKSDKFKDCTDLVVSEKDGKAILLDGSKLLYFDLKNM